MGGVLHTMNPRLFDDQLAYIATHAEDRVLLYDAAFQPLVDRMKPPKGQRWESRAARTADALVELARQVEVLPRLHLRGLMTVPEPNPDADVVRRQFRLLRELRNDLAARGFVLDTLSMGMSEDLDLAIAEGATMVRVGRAIFGDRPGKGLAF